MSGEASSAEQVARELADAFEARGDDYAVGGALALASSAARWTWTSTSGSIP